MKTNKNDVITNLIKYEIMIEDLIAGKITLKKFIEGSFPYAIEEALLMLEYGETEMPINSDVGSAIRVKYSTKGE